MTLAFHPLPPDNGKTLANINYCIQEWERDKVMAFDQTQDSYLAIGE
jgi:hypothetical protein